MEILGLLLDVGFLGSFLHNCLHIVSSPLRAIQINLLNLAIIPILLDGHQPILVLESHKAVSSFSLSFILKFAFSIDIDQFYDIDFCSLFGHVFGDILKIQIGMNEIVFDWTLFLSFYLPLNNFLYFLRPVIRNFVLLLLLDAFLFIILELDDDQF